MRWYRLPSAITPEAREEYEGDNEALLWDFFPGDRFLLEVEGADCYLCQTDQHDLCQLTLHTACQCWKNNHEEEW